MNNKKMITFIFGVLIVIVSLVIGITSVSKNRQETSETIKQTTVEETSVKESSSSTTKETVSKTTTVKPTETTEATTEYIEEDVDYEEDYYEEEYYEEEYYEEDEYYEDAGMISLGEFRLTAYCNCSICCGVWAGGATASGVMPESNHTIAVDTDVIPFGVEVIINGNTYVAEDTGSAIVGNRIDIFFDNHQDALDFGVQYAEVFMVN